MATITSENPSKVIINKLPSNIAVIMVVTVMGRQVKKVNKYYPIPFTQIKHQIYSKKKEASDISKEVMELIYSSNLQIEKKPDKSG